MTTAAFLKKQSSAPSAEPSATATATPLARVTPLPSMTPVPGMTPMRGMTPVPGTIPYGKVKGTLLSARMKYLRARGPDEAERVLRRLSAADQQVLRGMVLPSSWYAADLVLRFEMTIVALLSRGDRNELFLDMGRFTADTNLGRNGVQRPYLQEGDPQYLLRNLPRMYAAQHTDDGVRTSEPMGAKAAVVRTTGGEQPNPEDCLTAVGWLKRAIELSGGRIVTVEETRCRGRGGPCCEFVCRWA
ncbi:MAG TPA: 4-vinyl reductase [Anaeromyxobacter sp.]